MNQSILLVKTPFFSPLTPPLGIAILKSFLEQHNYPTTCYDFNVDAELWGTHHKYFKTLQQLEGVTINDGYSKLWWILNAHMLAYANGADAATCARTLDKVIPMYGIKHDESTIETLLPIVERYFARLEETIDELNMSEFSVVGTSTYSTSLGSSLFFLKKIKERFPHIKTVMGGGIFADDLALGSDNLATLIEEYPFVDHIVLGEGEMLFLKLIEGELAHKRVITLSDLKAGSLDMKDVPVPDFSDFSLENYYHLTIEGARSCPFQCSFCSETIQWGKYRKKPMGEFADQVVELAERFNNPSFFMGDSLMNPYIAEFSSELLSRNASINYDGYLRADKPVLHRDRVKQWARSGLYRVRLGIESASARVLDMMDKMTTPQVISDVFKSLANAGIRPTTYWIVGFPGETEQDFQETLDFIKENHRYIYELEAHPYYYYPYGQIGSRLYQCYPLYPQEVTDIIKFKVWEIIDSNPTREERYDRLRRISALASELNLPNIYTMSERYEAEDRWHSMYPLASEIYEGTRLNRPAAQLPDKPFARFEQASSRTVADDASNANPVLCYRTTVAAALDEATLTAAMRQLIRSCEMLQVSLDGENFVPAREAEDAPQGDAALVTSFAPGEAEVEDLKRELFEKFSQEMRPERGASVRLAHIKHGDASHELLLFAHRSIADGRSLTLLLEDLFRIYEQLSNDVPVSLRPARRSYPDFVTALTANGNAPTREQPNPGDDRAFTDLSNGMSQPVGDEAGCATLNVVIDEKLRERIVSRVWADYGLKSGEALVIALLRSIAEAGADSALEVDVADDYRQVETALEYTVGGLTRVSKMPHGILKNDDLMSSAQEVQDALRNVVSSVGSLAAPRAGENGTPHEFALLNLEYFLDEPWLGGDAWTPRGFLLPQRELRQPYVLEITPVLSKDAIHVSLVYQDTAQLRNFAGRLANTLSASIDATLNRLAGGEDETFLGQTITVDELENFSF